ncbi:hypothetical protein [Streptomyces noursei]
MEETTVWVRRLRRNQPPSWALHAHRECPALARVTDAQLERFTGNAGATMDAYSDLCEQAGTPHTSFLLCVCMLTADPRTLPDHPPWYRHVTIEAPAATC